MHTFFLDMVTVTGPASLLLFSKFYLRSSKLTTFFCRWAITMHMNKKKNALDCIFDVYEEWRRGLLLFFAQCFQTFVYGSWLAEIVPRRNKLYLKCIHSAWVQRAMTSVIPAGSIQFTSCLKGEVDDQLGESCRSMSTVNFRRTSCSLLGKFQELQSQPNLDAEQLEADRRYILYDSNISLHTIPLYRQGQEMHWRYFSNKLEAFQQSFVHKDSEVDLHQYNNDETFITVSSTSDWQIILKPPSVIQWSMLRISCLSAICTCHGGRNSICDLTCAMEFISNALFPPPSKNLSISTQ